MRIRKILTFALLMFIIVLSGCGSNNSPEQLWNKYIAAMNSKDINKVAEIYYEKDSINYNKFLEEKDAEEYFADFDKLTTIAFTPILINENYYQADVELSIDDFNAYMDIFFIRDKGMPWRFISEVDATNLDPSKLGNKATAHYYNTIIKNAEGFDYKYVYGGTPGIKSSSDYIKIVYPNNKAKIIEIPDEIEGQPVTFIGDFAFYDYFRLFTVTFTNSKLQQIKLPNQLQVIDKYAFFQTKNLKYIELPKTMKTVGNYAFASSGVEKFVINVDDEDAYAALVPKNGNDSLKLLGNKVIFMDETPTYSVVGYAASNLEWSVSDEDIATIDSSGKLTTVGVGTVEIKAKLNETIYVTGDVEIKAKEDKEAQSSLPTEPALSSFRFKANKVYFTTEELTPSLPLAFSLESSDTSIARIEGTKVKFVGAGTVTITATPTSNPNVKTSLAITVKDIVEKTVVSKYSYDSFNFTGARDMFRGDYIKLVAPGFTESEIEWSSSNTAVATVGKFNGVVTAKAAGTITIKATKVDNPNISVQVVIVISEPVAGVEFYENSMDRLNNLKELVINSINPYSISFQGNLKLNDKVKIYVPAQNIDTYKEVFSDYSKNIFPIE